MSKFKKLQKALVLGICGMTLFLAGGNPAVQDATFRAKRFIEMPISHADDGGFDLSRRVTIKQFTVSDGSVNGQESTDSGLNLELSDKVRTYLDSVNNLNDYHVHTSRISTTPTGSNHAYKSETATLVFIRK